MNMTGFAAQSDAKKQTMSQKQNAAESTFEVNKGNKLDAVDFALPAADTEVEGTESENTETPAIPENTVAIVGSDYYPSLNAAFKAVTAEGATDKAITLYKNAVLSGTESYDLTGVTVDTKGYLITVEKGANITLSGSGSFINEELATPGGTNPVTWISYDKSHTIFHTEAGSTLNITGGTFNTKGVKLLAAEGDVNISGGTFACNISISGEGEEPNHFNSNNHYDGASLFNITGQGRLVMTGGSINANIGSGSDGMYGIYVNQGGIVELGTEAAAAEESTAAGPSIDSYFAAVGMRHESPTGNLTVHSGTYQSHVVCTGNNERYNAVLYLAALCDVTITGGTFTAPVGTAEVPVTTTHIMSAPEVADRSVTVTGGTFTSGGQAFYGDGLKDKKVVRGGSFLEGAKTGLDKNLVSGYELNENGSVNQKDSSVAIVKGKDGAVDTKWNTLAEAIENSNAGDTIELKSNIELTGTHLLTLTGKILQTKGYSLIVKDSAKVKIAGGTINNDAFATYSADGKSIAETHSIVRVEAGGRLAIEGGAYTTNSVEALHILGEATVTGNASFACTATGTNKPADWTNWNYYDGSALVTVGRKAILKMENGSVTADVGNGTNCGMYGIYAYNDGQVILGTGSETGPEIRSVFAAVGTNNTQPAAFITINGGNYYSSVNCTNSGELKFNAVLYLAATSKVVINGGHFEATADNKEAHVISIPYTDNGAVTAQVNLTINGGEFKAVEKASNVFFVGQGGNTEKKGLVKGGNFSTSPSAFLAAGYTASKGDGAEYYTVALSCKHEKIKAVPAKEPTCTEEGMDAHYQCENCGQRFYSADGKEGSELADSDVILPKALHESERFTVKAQTDATTCQDWYDTKKPTESGTYYHCVNCGNTYANITDLKNSENPVTTLKRGDHVYGEGNAAYTINWGSLTENKTFTNKAEFDVFADSYKESDVKVSKECTLCQEAAAVEGTISLASDAETVLKDYTCTPGEAGKEVITYTVSLTTGAPDEKVPTAETTTSIGTRTATINGADHQYEYVWKNTDSEQTATCGRYCKSCGRADALEQSKEIEKFNEDGKTAMTRDCWTTNKIVVLKAFFGEATEAANSFTGNMSVAGQHNLTRCPYQAPTCAVKGQKAHYKCDKCKGYYLSPLATEKKDMISEADKEAKINIAPILHNFGAPRFEWEDETALSAKATFTCTQCQAYVTLSGEDAVTVDVDKKTSSPNNATCETQATITYPVSVDFDSANVSDGERDAFGDMILIYGQTPSEEAAENYTGKLVRSNVIAGHRFKIEPDTLKWIDAGTNGKYYDTAKGVSVDIKCADCGGVVTITTNNGASVKTPGSSAITNLSGRVTFTRSADLSSNASCTSDGTDTYNVTVTCMAGPDTDYKTIEQESGDPLTLTNRTKARGHDFVISRQTPYGKGVEWDDRDSTINNATVPSDVIVRLVCKHDNRHLVTLTGKEEGNKDAVVLKPANDLNTYEDSPYVAQSCTKDGVNAWQLEVTYQGKKITKYDDSGEDVPESAAEGDTPETDTIYMTKTLPKTGHTYPEKGTWDYSKLYDEETKKINTEGAVYYTYECQNTTCSQEADTTDPQDDANLGIVSKNKWVKRLRATVEDVTIANGKTPATCTEKGWVCYKFTIPSFGENQPAENTLDIEVDALGHGFSVADDKLTWELAADMTANATPVEVTLDGKTVNVPPCTATATRTCSRCDETDELTTTVGQTSTAAKDGVTLKLKATAYTAPVCEQAGSVAYKATLLDSEGQELKTKTETKVIPAKAHDTTGPVHIDWESLHEEEILKGGKLAGYQFVVDAYIVCKNENCPNKNRPLPNGIAVEVTAEGSCKTGVTYKAVLAGDSVGDKTIESDNDTYSIAERASHKLKPVAARKSESCSEPSYKQHYHCTVCGKNYESPLAEKEYNVSFEGESHVYYGDPDWERLSDTMVQAVFTCSKCKKTVNKQAEIDTENVLYYPEEPKCEDAEKEPDAPEIWVYYPVKVDFNGTQYESSFGQVAPAADHKLNDNGVCEYCGNTFTAVNFYGINGTTGNAISTTYYKVDKEAKKVYLKTGGVYTEVTEADGIIAPVAPTHVGKVFQHWTLDGQNYDTNEKIQAAILTALQAGGSKELTITSTYKNEAVAKATITRYNVVGGNKVEASKVETTVEIGGLYTATAAEAVENVKFSHWSSNEDGTGVLSTNKEYKFYIATGEAKTIYAIYADQDTPDNVKAVKITDVYTTEVDGSYKISFVSGITLPDGCKFKSAGFVYATASMYQDTTKAEMEELLKIENVSDETQKIRQVERSGQTANIYTINLGSNTTRNVHVRGYVIYEDAEGNLMTEYSEVSTASYSSLNPAQQ